MQKVIPFKKYTEYSIQEYRVELNYLKEIFNFEDSISNRGRGVRTLLVPRTVLVLIFELLIPILQPFYFSPF